MFNREVFFYVEHNPIEYSNIKKHLPIHVRMFNREVFFFMLEYSIERLVFLVKMFNRETRLPHVRMFNID